MFDNSVLALRCEGDLLLHHLGPIGLAAARDTALLVDLDSTAPGYPGRLTVADLLNEGVRRADLGPRRKGVAVLGNGGAAPDDALELVDALVSGWPAVVIRAGRDPLPYPVVPVTPHFPASWPDLDRACVRQPVSRLAGRHEADGVYLPPLRRGQVAAMLAGRVQPRWRWVKAWRIVWEMAWD